jgi:hypothetical protein
MEPIKRKRKLRSTSVFLFLLAVGYVALFVLSCFFARMDYWLVDTGETPFFSFVQKGPPEEGVTVYNGLGYTVRVHRELDSYSDGRPRYRVGPELRYSAWLRVPGLGGLRTDKQSLRVREAR